MCQCFARKFARMHSLNPRVCIVYHAAFNGFVCFLNIFLSSSARVSPKMRTACLFGFCFVVVAIFVGLLALRLNFSMILFFWFALFSSCFFIFYNLFQEDFCKEVQRGMLLIRSMEVIFLSTILGCAILGSIHYLSHLICFRTHLSSKD